MVYNTVQKFCFNHQPQYFFAQWTIGKSPNAFAWLEMINSWVPRDFAKSHSASIYFAKVQYQPLPWWWEVVDTGLNQNMFSFKWGFVATQYPLLRRQRMAIALNPFFDSDTGKSQCQHNNIRSASILTVVICVMT